MVTSHRPTIAPGDRVGIEWGTDTLEGIVESNNGRHVVVRIAPAGTGSSDADSSTISVPTSAVRAFA